MVSCVDGSFTGGCALMLCEQGCWLADRLMCCQWMPLGESVFQLPLMCCVVNFAESGCCC